MGTISGAPATDTVRARRARTTSELPAHSRAGKGGSVVDRGEPRAVADRSWLVPEVPASTRRIETSVYCDAVVNAFRTVLPWIRTPATSPEKQHSLTHRLLAVCLLLSAMF
jgi:hypothetical protein